MRTCRTCGSEIVEAAPPPPPPPSESGPRPDPRLAFGEPDRTSVPLGLPERRRRGWLIVSSVAIAAVLAMLLAEGAVSRSSAIATLERRALDDIDVSVAHPAGWRVTEDSYGTSFKSGEIVAGVSMRGFRIEPVDIDYDDVKQEAEALDRSRLASHTLLDTGRGTRAGRDTYKRVLFSEGLLIEQWWIERGKKDDPLRVEFWSRAADDDAHALNSRIVDSLQLDGELG